MEAPLIAVFLTLLSCFHFKLCDGMFTNFHTLQPFRAVYKDMTAELPSHSERVLGKRQADSWSLCPQGMESVDCFYEYLRVYTNLRQNMPSATAVSVRNIGKRSSRTSADRRNLALLAEILFNAYDPAGERLDERAAMRTVKIKRHARSAASLPAEHLGSLSASDKSFLDQNVPFPVLSKRSRRSKGHYKFPSQTSTRMKRSILSDPDLTAESSEVSPTKEAADLWDKIPAGVSSKFESLLSDDLLKHSKEETFDALRSHPPLSNTAEPNCLMKPCHNTAKRMVSSSLRRLERGSKSNWKTRAMHEKLFQK